MIKAAIFDADGTLLDSMHIWNDAITAYLKQFDIIPDMEVLTRIATMSVKLGSVFLKEH